MEKLRVFVGSSKESRAVVECISAELRRTKFSIIPWYHDDFTAPGSHGYFLDQLVDAPNQQDFDFAIFVLGKDDKTKSRDRLYFSPRDNVLFELGIFMAKLGRDRHRKYRTFVLGPKPWKARLKIPSDWQGFTPYYYEPPTPATKANLEKVLKPVILAIKRQMETSGSRETQYLEHVSWVGPLLEEYVKGSAKPRVIKNLALDVAATWDLYRALLQQPHVRKVTIQTLMMDGNREELIVASGEEPPTAERALKSEHAIVKFCQANAADLAKREIRFECRAYSQVPIVHGFLMQQHKLLLTMLLVKDGKMFAIPNPYWELNYPKTKSTVRNRTVRHTFEAYERWFDHQWSKARPVWPTGTPTS